MALDRGVRRLIPNTKEDLLSLAADLRKEGVRSYKCSGSFGSIEFTLDAPEPKQPKPPPPVKSKKCACGHEEWQHHNNGLCAEGCGPEKCAPEKP